MDGKAKNSAFENINAEAEGDRYSNLEMSNIQSCLVSVYMAHDTEEFQRIFITDNYKVALKKYKSEVKKTDNTQYCLASAYRAHDIEALQETNIV